MVPLVKQSGAGESRRGAADDRHQYARIKKAPDVEALARGVNRSAGTSAASSRPPADQVAISGAGMAGLSVVAGARQLITWINQPGSRPTTYAGDVSRRTVR